LLVVEVVEALQVDPAVAAELEALDLFQIYLHVEALLMPTL
jgi:hypothetical protein